MPLLKLETTAVLPDEQRATLLASLSRLVAETIGKPETYVMVIINPAAIQMSGAPGDAALVDIRSIGGLNHEVNRKLSEGTCALLRESLGIPPERVYLNFTDVSAGNWGWKSGTLG